MGAAIYALSTDVVNFNKDMSTLPRNIQIWAALFPLPQFVFGTYCAFKNGPYSIGALFLYVRISSFVVAGQFQKRKPFTKLMGPFMHLPFYGLVPYAINWLHHTPKPEAGSPDCIEYGFVAYTCVITSISLLSDTKVLVKWLMGKDVGTYKDLDNEISKSQ